MKLVPKLKGVTRRRERADPPRGDETAYLALEAARLTCERQHASEQDHRDRLCLLHRQLGLAGFYVSSELLETRRRERLELARVRSEKRAGATVDAVSSIPTLMRDAQSAMEGAMEALGPREHLHLAHLYVLGAVEVLAAWSRPVQAVKPGSRAA
jgi:hypothetical protein